MHATGTSSASPSASPTAALLVDVGGVLLLPNPEHLVPVVARHGGVNTHEGFLRAHFAAWNAAYPTHGTFRDYYQLLPERAGVPPERRALCAAEYLAISRTRNMWHYPDQASRRALAELTASDVRVAIVSQADGTIAQMLLDAKMCQEGDGPGVTVDAVIDSAIVGYDKPDPRLFAHALDVLEVPPARAVYVGDTAPMDVRGARAAGVAAVHYDPYDDCDDPSDHDHIRTLGEVAPYLRQAVGRETARRAGREPPRSRTAHEESAR